MTRLRILSDDATAAVQCESADFAEIQDALSRHGITLERWQADAPLGPDASDQNILRAYQDHIDRLAATEGYRSWDVISLRPDHPDKAALRQKFLDEHIHAEDEVRFFVRGRGLFSLHLQGVVCELLCTQGDLIRVPAGTRHWFDMGPAPDFTAIRLFNNPEGWVAQFTGSDIADRYSRLQD